MTQDEADAAALGGGATWRTITLVVMALLGAAVLVALILTLGSANRERDRALELQAHSYDVMILARTLSGTIARSEASLGRYVISGDKQLGRLYFDEWVLAGSQINRLEQLTYDNTEQRARVALLRRAYQDRGSELSLTALSTNYGKNSQAYAHYYQGRNAPTLIAINSTLDQLIARERALLDDRTAGALGSVERSSSIAGVLAVFGMLIVLGAIGLGWFTIRAVGDRAVAQADADMERSRAEELVAAVAHATAELRVQEAKLRQIQKMEAVGQLTGGIAHDFNNMLAVVLGGLELAQRTMARDPVAARRHIDSASDGANRAAALTRRLLAFSREDSLKPEPLGVAGLVEGMSDLLDRTLGDAITLRAVDASDGWRVRADRVQLENAVLNLAVNARDAMNGRGTMTVTTGAATLAQDAIGHCPPGDYATIAVSDTGCGMTAAVAERVFEPFFTTKETGKGTGLGLSQIFGLVRQLGGEVEIVSAPGDGTTVTLYLPRDAADPAVDSQSSEMRSPAMQSPAMQIPPMTASAPPAAIAMETERSAAPAPSPDANGLASGVSEPDGPEPDGPEPDSLRVLVVEDDPRVLAATTGALEELGHFTIACDDPVNAASLLARHGAVDLIISDVLMPRRTGPEMIAALRPLFPDVAVLFVTGFAGEATTSEFGEHEVLRKPFTLGGLERAIAAAMAPHPSPSSRQIAAE